MRRCHLAWKGIAPNSARRRTVVPFHSVQWDLNHLAVYCCCISFIVFLIEISFIFCCFTLSVHIMFCVLTDGSWPSGKLMPRRVVKIAKPMAAIGAVGPKTIPPTDKQARAMLFVSSASLSVRLWSCPTLCRSSAAGVPCRAPPSFDLIVCSPLSELVCSAEDCSEPFRIDLYI